MHQSELQRRFPNMRPINSPPGLGTINGIGMMVYGERDRDPETGTYVTTQCFTLLFIPVLCLGAYRVASAGREGWYFLGKEPLSVVAKGWNVLVLGGILSVALFLTGSAYFSSDDYKDGRKLSKADALLEDGKLAEAADLYRAVASGSSQHNHDAADRLAKLVEERLGDAPIDEARRILNSAVQVKSAGRWPASGPDLLALGMELAEKQAANNPLDGMKTLETVERLSKDREDVIAFRRKLIEQVVEAHPTNATYVIPFAVSLHEEGEVDRARRLLERVRGQLGSTEGARILGQMLAREGNLDEAHALLVPYTEARLSQLHQAEDELNAAFERAQQQAINRLQTGNAAGFSFTAYDAANEQKQQEMVDDFVMKVIQGDPGIEQARERVMQEAEIVPTALDLGIVMLRRAQGMSQGDTRQTELERAEKTFLAIRGVAGETDEYRLFLGQVYYWLDRHDEGRALFDELLTANQRSSEMLTAVGAVLREVGANSEARAMLEESYDAAVGTDEKHQAAHQRALLADEIEDEIKWLRLADIDDLSIKASLSTTLGRQAVDQGDEEEARRHYREAIDAYAKLPETAASLNNSALTYLALYHLDGKRETLDEVVRRIDKAVSLSPSDSILLFNAASLMMQVAMEDIIGGKIDYSAVKASASLSLLGYLYNDQQQLDALTAQVREHPVVEKAVGYMDKVLVLAPKQEGVYRMKSALHAFTDDEPALEHLLQRLNAAQPDVSDTIAATLENYAGTDDAKNLADGLKRAQLAEKSVAETNSSGGLTHAVALNVLLGQKMLLARLGQPVDADEVVRQSEEAHTVAPSVATEGVVLAALLFRADQNLAAANSDYAKLREQSRRTLSASDRIAVALAQSNGLLQDVLKDADVTRSLAILVDANERLPKQRSSWEWAMMQASLPEEADATAERLAGDDVARLQRQIDIMLSPADASESLHQYWAQLATDNRDEAKETLRRLEEHGVPLPIAP